MENKTQFQDDFKQNFDFQKYSKVLASFHSKLRDVADNTVLVAKYLNGIKLYELIIELIRSNQDLVSGKSLTDIKEMVGELVPVPANELYFPVVRTKKRPTYIKEEIGYDEIVKSVSKIAESTISKDDKDTVIRDIRSFVNGIKNPQDKDAVRSLRYVVGKYDLNLPKNIKEKLK